MEVSNRHSLVFAEVTRPNKNMGSLQRNQRQESSLGEQEADRNGKRSEFLN